ncbi:CDP-diacylglycerol-serine O-phosphatidyltransferase, partial [Aaosphaeria arxii CBS 175.79]
FIYLSYEFDRLDGLVAVWRDECSEMGKQLDSLPDLITFGVAPVIMLYSVGFRTPVDQTVLIFYVLCGVARLARFNITADTIPKNEHGRALYYEGITISYAALVISTAVAVYCWIGRTSEDYVLMVLFIGTWSEFHPAIIPVIAIGAAMVSKRLKLPGV